MLKKSIAIVGATAAGVLLFAGTASAGQPGHHHGKTGHYAKHTHHVNETHKTWVDNEEFAQFGLVNLNNTSALNGINVSPGICDNNVNVLGVQVPVQDSLNGIAIPVLAQQKAAQSNKAPEVCAASSVEVESEQGVN